MSHPSDPACTCFRLRRTARVVSQVYDQALAVVDLSLNEYSILKHTAPQARGLGELAAQLGMDRSTLTRNAAPLVSAGWLTVRKGDDARQKVLAITASGRRRLTLARPHWRRAQDALQAAFGDDATQRLHRGLDQLHTRLSALRDTPA